MATDHILIIGTGFAGLGMGIALKEAGIHDFTIVEQASGVGGTWRDNHYPGAACDVESHLYSFSFEPNPRWSRSFGTQPEILAYLEHCASKYGLRSHIRFNAKVTSATYDALAGEWTVATSDGETARARVVVSGTGGLSRPAYPSIPGLASFEGKTFHSARWDHAVSLAGKTVGVIGTGASSVQIVPSIAPIVERLHLFQRTPPWIVPKPDHPITARAQAIYGRFPLLQRLVRDSIYVRRELFGIGFTMEPRILELAERLVRLHLARSVRDPDLRAKLTPSYKLGCKRVLPTNDWFPALQRSNVEVVTEAIESITPRGVRTKDGKERALDALVLATGFQAAEAVAPFPIQGRDGVDLNEAWRDGAEAYLGTAVTGFPNMFMIVGPNTGLGHTSMVVMIEAQIAYVTSAIQAMRARGLRAVEVRRDVQARFNTRIHERLEHTVWNSGCSSWYRTKSGKNTTLWPGLTVEYRLRARRFDESAYELTPG